MFLLLLGFSSQILCDECIHEKEYNFLSDVRSKDLRPLSLQRKFNSPFVVALRDKKNINIKFILKQKTNYPLSSVMEKLAADIAYAVDIPANQIKAIPCHSHFVGKKKKSLPATLHTFVPGVQINRLPKPVRRTLGSLRQAVKKTKDKTVYGLTEELIKLMSLHEDLPKIIALDTFIANHDRHKGNYFYDEKSDHFFVFDFEAAFRRNLAEKVYRSLSVMIKDKDLTFSPEEIKALAIYRDMLKRLIDEYPPGILSALFSNLIDTFQIDISGKHDQWRNKMHNRMILTNYNSCIKVVRILDILIEKFC